MQHDEIVWSARLAAEVYCATVVSERDATRRTRRDRARLARRRRETSAALGRFLDALGVLEREHLDGPAIELIEDVRGRNALIRLELAREAMAC